MKSCVRSISCKPNWTRGGWLGSRSADFARAWALASFWFLVRHQSACLRLLWLESCVELCWSSAKGFRSFVLARLAFNLQTWFLCPINCCIAVAFQRSPYSSLPFALQPFWDLADRHFFLLMRFCLLVRKFFQGVSCSIHLVWSLWADSVNGTRWIDAPVPGQILNAFVLAPHPAEHINESAAIPDGVDVGEGLKFTRNVHCDSDYWHARCLQFGNGCLDGPHQLQAVLSLPLSFCCPSQHADPDCKQGPNRDHDHEELTDHQLAYFWIHCFSSSWLAACYSSVRCAGTIVIPIGAMAMRASLMCWIPKGIPITVTKQASAEVRWPIASHHPATKNQIMFPISPNGPVPRSTRPLRSRRFMASKPKGHRANVPITKHDRLHGNPTMLTAEISPTSHQPKAIGRPPRTTQRILKIDLSILSFLPDSGN